MACCPSDIYSIRGPTNWKNFGGMPMILAGFLAEMWTHCFDDLTENTWLFFSLYAVWLLWWEGILFDWRVIKKVLKRLDKLVNNVVILQVQTPCLFFLKDQMLQVGLKFHRGEKVNWIFLSNLEMTRQEKKNDSGLTETWTDWLESHVWFVGM